MDRRERLSIELLNSICSVKTESDNAFFNADVFADNHSSYKKIENPSGSVIYSVNSILDMRECMYKSIGNEEAATAMTSLVFYDKKKFSNVESMKNDSEVATQEVEIPTYTYTL